MKNYKIKINSGRQYAYEVYRRRFFFFWRFLRCYKSMAKAMSAVQMFELNDKKKK